MNGQTEEQREALDELAREWWDDTFGPMDKAEFDRLMDMLGKLRGQLDERPTVNVLLDPQWIKVEAVLLAALRPFPEARVAAARALEELESAGG